MAQNPHIICLAGAPNSGKTTLFNALTGSSQKVGNYPGVTVEQKSGELTTPAGKVFRVVDLPGFYSLSPQSIDEQIAYDVLHGNMKKGIRPDLLIVVIDSSSLERTLGLALEIKKLKIPMIVVLNMIDLAKSRGLKINLKSLSKKLNLPVVETIGTDAKTLSQLFNELDKELPKSEAPNPIKREQSSSTQEEIVERFAEVDKILEHCIIQPITHDQLTLRLDKILLHKLWGNVALFFIMLFMFQSVFSWASLPMDLIDNTFGTIGNLIGNTLNDGLLKSLLVDGIIAGVGSVIIFLPQILILFLFITILEGTGYMARAAFLIDRLMATIGLQGKSFVPLLSSFACAIPGIMATRTIKNHRDRLITIMIVPLMTCSARLPVYVVLIGAFIPQRQVMGLLNLQGLVFFGLFLLGVFSAIIVGFVMKFFLKKSQQSTFILELPTYKLPSAKNILVTLLQRAKIFLKKAGTVIMAISIGLWVLSSFPTPPKDWSEPAINYSFAGRIGKAVEPLVEPIGFDWRIATGLIPGFAAREVMVGALGTVLSIEDADEGSISLRSKIAEAWGLPTGLALLVWYVYSPQCLATLVVARKETDHWKWPAIMFTYMIFLAYIGAFITYRLAKLLY